jgi:predicted sulfurtransferase
MFRLIIQNTPKRYYSALSSARPVTSSQLSNWLTTKDNQMYSDVVVVDVRERHEIEKYGKIKGAINVPFKLEPTMFAAGLSDISKHDKVNLFKRLGCHWLTRFLF